MFFGIFLGLLALSAGLLYRARTTGALDTGAPLLSDEMVRQIEDAGYIDVDEPLDLDEIQEEEARFWDEQPWEESDEW